MILSAAAVLTPPGERAAGGRGERVLYVRTATFWRRLLAAAIDTLVIALVASAATSGTALALAVPLPGLAQIGPDLLLEGVLDRSPMAVGALGLAAGIGALYHIYLGGVAGQTLGKRLLRLRVISSRGTPPGPLGGILRLAAASVSILPAGLGWLWCLFDRERRALHDHLAGTYVIVDEP